MDQIVRHKHLPDCIFGEISPVATKSGLILRINKARHRSSGNFFKGTMCPMTLLQVYLMDKTHVVRGCKSSQRCLGHWPRMQSSPRCQVTSSHAARISYSSLYVLCAEHIRHASSHAVGICILRGVSLVYRTSKTYWSWAAMCIGGPPQAPVEQ